MRIRIRILFRLESHKKLNYYMKNGLKVGTVIGQKYTYQGTKLRKSFLKDLKLGLFVILVRMCVVPKYGSGSRDSQISLDPSGSTTLEMIALYCSCQ